MILFFFSIFLERSFFLGSNFQNFSLKFDDFQDYVYSAGIKDDGVGETLGEFSQFSIKIVMQGTNAAEPPRIRDLRIIALAT